MELFQRFLNKARQTYGQVDKKVFGGLLPGGAATPIGAAFQNVNLPEEAKPLSPTRRRYASLLDAATSGIANAQPVVERTIKTAPKPIQETIASGLNALPFSVNLFSRYYTGIGNKNLEVPQSALAGIKPILDYASKNKEKLIKENQSSVDNLSYMLNSLRSGKFPLNQGFVPSVQALNDSLAAAKSDLNRIKKGDIPFIGYNTTNTNPLTSGATSFGRLWFEPTNNGYQSKEKYDFAYGAADKFAEPIPGVQLTPSQRMILDAVNSNPNSQIETSSYTADTSPITNIGRAIVSKLPKKDFDYLIDVR